MERAATAGIRWGETVADDFCPEGDRPDETSLPPSLTVSFLHAVGQSSLRQGLTVPVIAQISWLKEIRKGQCVDVTIVFGTGQSVPASLRRINNARGHLQFRYETRKQADLRNYLSQVFGKAPDGTNGLLRITEVQPRVFLFEPVSVGRQTTAHLAICQPHFHNCSQEDAEGLVEFNELQECFRAVPYNETHGQADYNKRIASTLRAMAWREEARILDEIGLRSDFEKNGTWVEVEFGNARVYYQDYIKFLLASRYKDARLGILLCPTNAFAQLLCDLGKQRALARKGTATERAPSYSGMMSYEKAIRELPFLQFMLTSRTVIAGIEIQSSSAELSPLEESK
jgi:hypothetical protein